VGFFVSIYFQLNSIRIVSGGAETERQVSQVFWENLSNQSYVSVWVYHLRFTDPRAMAVLCLHLAVIVA